LNKKKADINKNKSKYNKYLDYLLPAAFAVLIIFFTTSKLTNEDDYFWHLATGRYIVQNGSIPSLDVFSYSTQGQPWLVTEWGWDVITYFVFNTFGYVGLSILNSLVFLLIFGIYFYILNKFKVSYTLITFFSIVLVFGIFERITPRPHIITYLFFVLLMGLLINFKYFERTKYKKLFIIPIVFLLWANMHMGCVIGILIFAVFLVSEYIIFLRPSKFSSKEIAPLTKNELKRIVIIFVCSILAMFINPHGINTYLYALFSQAEAKMLHEAVMEWISPFSPRLTGKFHNNIYIFMLIGFVPILFSSIKRKDLFAGVICALFAINSVRALRFTVDYELISFPFFVLSISYYAGKIKNLNVRSFINEKPALKIIIVLIITFLVYSVPNNRLYHHYLTYARFAGTGLDENYYPVKMFDFIRENKINEIGNKPFNTFECGGFFIWNFPNQKDFFDSRDLNDFIMNEYQTLISRLPGFENKIKEYDFDYAICVIPDIASDPQIMKQSIISYFALQSETWKLVYWNDHSLLFVKDLPKFENIISDNEYKYLTPYNLYFQKGQIEKGIKMDKDRVLQEVERKHVEDPYSIFLNNFLVIYRNKLL
jgi:hypothetical protein